LAAAFGPDLAVGLAGAGLAADFGAGADLGLAALEARFASAAT
jgi:hypothetical protein